MEFFQTKKKNTFRIKKCENCEFSSHSDEELNLHEQICYKKHLTHEINVKNYPSSNNLNGGKDLDYIMDIACSNNTPNSLKIIKNNEMGTISGEKYLVNESIELEHFVERNHIKLPNFNSGHYDLSESSMNKSVSGFMGSAAYSQNNSFNIPNPGSDHKINNNNLGEIPKQHKLCIISPSDHKDRKDKNRKCIVCKNLKIGEIVKMFACNDIVHLHCFKEELIGSICPSCNNIIQ